MTKAPAVLKTHKPTGPWLSDADLRHDWAINIGLPGYHDGKLKLVSIWLSSEQIREFQKRYGGNLVVDQDLIRDLQDLYLLLTEVNRNPPATLTHQKYPEMFFAVNVHQTVRPMKDPVLGGRDIPGPVRFLTFLAFNKAFTTGGKPWQEEKPQLS